MNSKQITNSKDKKASNCNKDMANAVLNDVYECQSFKSNILNSWKSGEKFDYKIPEENFEEIMVTKKPYNCALLPNILQCDSFLNSLVEELNLLPVDDKQNDLFKFKLSDDLKGVEYVQIQKLCSFFKNTMKPWMEDITGIKLNENISLSCSKYNYSDTLLCHDDTLEGRRVAFILYLVPPWKKAYGGSLDLFNIDDLSRPWNIEKQIYPVWNSLAFFEVSSISFHQVAEILVKDRTRLSINGWFHGDPIQYPARRIAPPHIYLFPKNVQEKEVYSWINPLYLEESTQADIRKKFIRDSEIELVHFLKTKKYKQLSCCFSSNDCQWIWTGPPNRKHYQVLHRQKSPQILRDFLKLLHSEAMFLILSQVTGLQLHHLAPPPTDDESEDQLSDQVDSTEEGYSSSSDGMEVKATQVNPHKRKMSSCSVWKSSKRGKGDTKLQRQHTFNEGWQSDIEKDFLDSFENGDSVEEFAKAECMSQIIRWSRGTYSMMRDDDNIDVKEFVLDTRFFCNADHWNSEMGGSKHYVATEDKDELLNIEPASNCLSLVYRDKETYQFTKYINSKGGDYSYQEICAQYREIGQSSSLPS